VVYLVKDLFEESKKDLENLINDKKLQGIPILILFNYMETQSYTTDQILLEVGFEISIMPKNVHFTSLNSNETNFANLIDKMINIAKGIVLQED
jgi:hypothetical protein